MSVSILVVDDEPDVADLFRQRFRRESRQGTFVMHFAASGAEALDRLAHEIQPRLAAVLSDINMPGVNAGEKMHQRAGVKLHQDGMPKASIGGLLLGDKQDEKRIASPENVTQASSVASSPMFPLPH